MLKGKLIHRYVSMYTDVESTAYRNSISLTNDELLIVINNVIRLKNRVNI